MKYRRHKKQNRCGECRQVNYVAQIYPKRCKQPAQARGWIIKGAISSGIKMIVHGRDCLRISCASTSTSVLIAAWNNAEHAETIGSISKGNTIFFTSSYLAPQAWAHD